MSKRTYNKSPRSFQDQLQLLKDRNLTINNDAKALACLANISYYRLSAYFLPYQQTKDRFDDGTTFEQIIETYSFDRELRLLVFDCIERIEIAVRTRFIYCMAIHYKNSHWQDDKELFIEPFCTKKDKQVNPFLVFQNRISGAKEARRQEDFIKHYTERYDEPANPPSWMCFELLTIGELSHLFRGLKNDGDKERIAKHFELHHKLFASWLLSINYVRNICAHHSRLWNKDLAVEPERRLKPDGNWVSDEFNNNNKSIFYFLCLLKYFLNIVNPDNHLKEKLTELFHKYPNVPIHYIGIPPDNKGNLLDWKIEPLWQIKRQQ